MTLSLLKFRVKSRNFVYARARNEVNSRDFVIAMYARARNAVVSITCKGSSVVNVVHTRAQKFCNFQGSCGACKGSKSCNFQGLNILQFPGFSACKGSRAPNAARSASLSRDFVRARVPHASICCLETCQIIGHQKTQNDNWMCKKSPKTTINIAAKITLDQLITTKKPNLDQQITSQLQFSGTLRDASITGSKRFNCQGFKCATFQKLCVHHWSTCRLYRLGSKNGHSGQILIQTWATPLVNTTRLFLQSIFRERTNIEYV